MLAEYGSPHYPLESETSVTMSIAPSLAKSPTIGLNQCLGWNFRIGRGRLAILLVPLYIVCLLLKAPLRNIADISRAFI